MNQKIIELYACRWIFDDYLAFVICQWETRSLYIYRYILNILTNVMIDFRTFFTCDYRIFYSNRRINKFLHWILMLTVDVLLFLVFHVSHIETPLASSLFLIYYENPSIMIFSWNYVGVSERKENRYPSFNDSNKDSLQWSQSVHNLSIHHRFIFTCFVFFSIYFFFLSFNILISFATLHVWH